MGYRLTNAAEQDLIDIYVDGAMRFGSAQAERYLGSMARAFELIADFPRIANERPEYTPAYRIHPQGVHVIIYLTNEQDEVLIVRVRHGREDWKSDPLDQL
ncbi:MAG: type II toxin-antitoxin system RelE/ParE family toxin [Rhizobiales bacterium]|nr:type II toxin-antitoxin system RelE/ParE family toxin [Hyphomicrobiales bacterium]